MLLGRVNLLMKYHLFQLKKVVLPAFGCVQDPKAGQNTQHYGTEWQNCFRQKNPSVGDGEVLDSHSRSDRSFRHRMSKECRHMSKNEEFLRQKNEAEQ